MGQFSIILPFHVNAIYQILFDEISSISKDQIEIHLQETFFFL